MNRTRRPRPIHSTLQNTLLEITRTDHLRGQHQAIAASLIENEQALRGIFTNCYDIVFRPLPVDDEPTVEIIYMKDLVDTKLLDELILKPLLFQGIPKGFGQSIDTIGLALIKQLVAVGETKLVSAMNDLTTSVVQGEVAVLIEGESQALIANLRGFEKRAIEDPVSESTIRGPRDGFTETLGVNTSMIRRRIASPRLKMEQYILGQISNTTVVIAYIDGIAPDTVLGEVRDRVNRIQADAIMGSGYLEEFIEDVPFSPFPQVQNTERPDVAAASLLEGKVAIMQNGTPHALIVPLTFWSGLQAAEDYYERFIYTTMVRWLRFVLLGVSLFLPSFYVAVTTYHPQLLPTALLISIAAAREGVPFPAVFEALMMEFMFEGLREAGIRLPKPVGSAVSIVGALVIGQAAVQAGLISAPVVIVVAATGISSFAIPRYNMGTAFRMLRFPMLILAGMFGLYGMAIGTLVIVIHLVSLRSFGIPYLSPVTPRIGADMKDVFVRVPWWSMNTRPAFISGANKTRIPKHQKPDPNRGRPEP